MGVKNLVLDRVPDIHNGTPWNVLSAQDALAGGLEEIRMLQHSSCLEHHLNGEILANAGLIRHFFDWQGTEIIVSFSRVSAASNESIGQYGERCIFDGVVIESRWDLFERDARPPFVGG